MRLLPVILLAAALAFLVSTPMAEAVEGKLTISDREIIERLARLEEGQKSLQKQVDDRINGLQNQINGLQNQVTAQGESLQAQISDLRQTMLGGFGILFAGMMGLIGFVLWDRRTALAPAIRNTEEVRRLLQEYARKEPKLAEAMKSLGLL